MYIFRKGRNIIAFYFGLFSSTEFVFASVR